MPTPLIVSHQPFICAPKQPLNVLRPNQFEQLCGLLIQPCEQGFNCGYCARAMLLIIKNDTNLTECANGHTR